MSFWCPVRRLALVAVIVPAVSASVHAAPCNQSGPGTALGNAAGNLAAGTWCQLTTGFAGGYTALYNRSNPGSGQVLYAPSSSGVHHNATYADSMAWNPLARKAHYSAWSHGGGGQKHAIYDDTTNTWSTGPNDPGNYGHGYDHMAANPETGDVYRMGYENARSIWKWNGSAWSTFATYPQYNYLGGIAWFPERGANGALIVYARPDDLYEYQVGSGWTNHTVAGGGQGYHMSCEYNPVHTLVMCTEGGASGFFILDDTGAPSARRTAPISLGINSAELSVDPVGGDFIVHGSGTTWRTYDPIANAWGSITHSMPPLTGQTNTEDYLQTPISNYGVIMFVTAWDNATYIYKHSEPTSGGTPPGAPSSLRPS